MSKGRSLILNITNLNRLTKHLMNKYFSYQLSFNCSQDALLTGLNFFVPDETKNNLT